jgi:hypothetical protein
MTSVRQSPFSWEVRISSGGDWGLGTVGNYTQSDHFLLILFPVHFGFFLSHTTHMLANLTKKITISKLPRSESGLTLRWNSWIDAKNTVEFELVGLHIGADLGMKHLFRARGKS